MVCPTPDNTVVIAKFMFGVKAELASLCGSGKNKVLNLRNFTGNDLKL
jgi:hypothetical protein